MPGSRSRRTLRLAAVAIRCRWPSSPKPLTSVVARTPATAKYRRRRCRWSGSPEPELSADGEDRPGTRAWDRHRTARYTPSRTALLDLPGAVTTTPVAGRPQRRPPSCPRWTWCLHGRGHGHFATHEVLIEADAPANAILGPENRLRRQEVHREYTKYTRERSPQRKPNLP